MRAVRRARELPVDGRRRRRHAAAFADSAITPLFPAGFTIFHTDGQWQTSDHTLVKEPSAVIELIYPDTEENRQHLLTLIEKIKTAFKQRAVLLEVTHSSINFY